MRTTWWDTWGSLTVGMALLAVAGCNPNRNSPPAGLYVYGPHGHGPHESFPTPHQPPAPAASPHKTADPKRYRPKVAVLPIEESTLYRAERVTIRNSLAAKLKQLMPDHEFVSLAEVDAVLTPVSPNGEACAYSHREGSERTDQKNWLSTHISNVYRAKGKSSYLNVRVSRRYHDTRSFSADWSSGTLTQRYAVTVPRLVEDDASTAGVLGALMGSGLMGARKDEHTQGALRICESNGVFGCAKTSAAWADKVKAITACYADVPTGSDQLLVDAHNRCEGVNLNTTKGTAAKRATCLCQAVAGSAGWNFKSGRRRLRLNYESAALKDRPRPDLRIASSTSNVRTDERTVGWSGGSARYLGLSNLSTLADGLSACEPLAADVPATADLVVSDAGRVTSVRLTLPRSVTSETGTVAVAAPKKKNVACWRSAFRNAAFDCTNNGKPGTVQMTMMWSKGEARN